jgi:hypothetical protein
MITVAIHADNKIIGIYCAKMVYSDEIVDDVLKGYLYHDRHGSLIVRLTKGEVSEDDNCDVCAQPLFVCNAHELTV